MTGEVEKAIAQGTTALLLELSHHPMLFISTLVAIIFIGVVVLLLPHMLKTWKEIQEHPVTQEKKQERKKEKGPRFVRAVVDLPTVTSMVNEVKDLITQECGSQSLRLNRILFALLRVTLYSESSPLWERLCAGYEYFAMGGDHGAEQWMVQNVFMKYPEALGMWNSVVNHYRQLKLDIIDEDAQKALDYVTMTVDRLQKKVE